MGEAVPSIENRFRIALNSDYVFLAILTTAGLVLRLHTIDSGLFGDEQHTVRVALLFPIKYIVTHHWGSFFHTILVHFLLPLGPLEFMARVPALIFGIFTIPVLYQTTRLLFGRKEALFAASYLVILPYHIYWSQMARGYTMCLLFSLLSLYYFIRVIEENKISLWAKYIVSSIFAIYSHLICLSWLPVHIIFLGVLAASNLINKKTRFWIVNKSKIFRFFVSFTLIAVIIFLLYLPFPNQTMGPIKQVQKISRPLGTYIKIFLNIVRQTFIWETQSWNSNHFFSLLLFIFLLLGLVVSQKNSYGRIILIILYIVIPISLFLLTKPSNSLIRNAPDRYFVFLLPFFFFLIARGATSFWQMTVKYFGQMTQREFSPLIASKIVSLGLVMTLLIFCGFLIPQLRQHYEFRKDLPDFKGALRYVNDHIEEDAVVVFEGSFFLFFEESNIQDGFPIYVDNYYKSNITTLTRYQLSRMLKKLIHQKKQLWGIVYTPERTRASEDILESVKSFHKISVVRFERELLGENLKKLYSALISLSEVNREDSHLILTKIFVLENNLEMAKHEIQLLQKSNELFSEDKSNLRPFWEFSIRSRRAPLYGQISNYFFKHGEYETSIFTFLKYASIMASKDKVPEIIDQLERYLIRRVSRGSRNLLTEKFLELLPFQNGLYLLWRDIDGWHLRWKSPGGEVKGKVVSAAKIQNVKKYGKLGKDQCNFSDHFISFRSITAEQEIAGVDFQTTRKSKVSFDLSMHRNRVKITLPKAKGEILKIIPPTVKDISGKANRTFIFVF